MKPEIDIASSAHDLGLLREAKDLTMDGWQVFANKLKGFKKPPRIAGLIPDLYAIKNGRVKIVSIETFAFENEQRHSLFRLHAQQNHLIRYYGWIVDEEGRRTQRFD